MRFRFQTKQLEALYVEEKGAHRFPPEVVESFFEVIATIDAAGDERDLYALKGLRYEKLSGKRAGQRSLRLNRQWRLIVEPESDEHGPCIVVVSIEDYH